MELSLGELVARLGGELVGDPAIKVRQIASLEAAGAGDIAFLSNPKLSAALETSGASAFILSPKAAGLTDRARIVTPDPYLYFARAAQLFNPPHNHWVRCQCLRQDVAKRIILLLNQRQGAL